MPLIERYTAGGNLYPDGNSTFAMLVQFFQRLAQNRDSRDTAIANAWKAGDTSTLSTARADATAKADAAELNAKVHADGAAQSARADAFAYTDASFAAAAPGGATDEAVDAAVDRAILAGRIVPDEDIAGLVATSSQTQEAVRGEIQGVVGVTLRGLGTADDSATVTAAFAVAGVQRVTIPAGATANTSGMIIVPAGKTLVLEPGATLQRVGTGTVQPLRLDAGATLTGGGTVDVKSSASYGISINGNGVAIRGVKVRGSINYAIGNNGFADLRVEGCEFTDNGSYALLNESASAVRTVFSGNRILSGGRGVMYKSSPDGVITGNLINITGGVAIEVFGSGSGRTTVSGNTVGGAPSIGISLASAVYTTVSGNTVTGCTSIGIENAEGASHNTISGNTVGNGSGAGITVTSGTNGVKPANDVAVTGNTINAVGSYGIWTEYGNSVLIAQNTVIDSANIPFFINNHPTSFSISGNTVKITDAGSTGLCMRITGTGHLIESNLLDFTEKTTQNNTGIRAEGGSRHMIQGNLIRGGTKGISVNNSPGTVVNNNRTIGATTNAVEFYGASSTPVLLTHIYTMAGGTAVSNTAGATITGPLIAVS